MKKTLTINISGIIFHIEEDAYDNLSKYLQTIKSYFKDSEGRDEIMGDIESRIAELLQEKLSTIKQVVTSADVDAVMAAMGKPEEFAGEEAQQTTSSTTEEKNTTYEYPKGRRRVFRDEDEKLLGGVCSGIANYFAFDPLWLRLAFAISFFGFGTGFLVYLILWIVIPKAKTTSEKLEMKGEPININNIEKAVKEEMEGVKKKANDFANDVKSNKGKVGSAVNKGVDLGVNLIQNAFRIALKIIAVFIVIVSLIALASIISVIGFAGSGDIVMSDNGQEITISAYDTLRSLFVNPSDFNTFLIGLFFLVGIPFIMLLYSAIKFLLNVKKKIRWVNYAALALWFVGLVLTLIIGFKFANDMKWEDSFNKEVVLKQTSCDTLILKGKEDLVKATPQHIKAPFFKMSTYRSSDIMHASLDVQKSANDSFYVETTFSARGENQKAARKRGENISYNFTQNDSVVEFERYFKIEKDGRWRDQQVQVTVYVPVGNAVYFDKSIRNIMYDVDNVTNTYDGDMIGKTWTMTPKGLDCKNCVFLDSDKDE